MSEYARIETLVRRANTAAYFNDAVLQSFSFDPVSPTKFALLKVSAATAGGTTVELGNFTTIQAIVIKNEDTTNFVTATYRTLADAANDNKMKILAGRHCTILEGRPANDLVLVADTAICDCTIYIIGA
jgi:hypothetical protein